MRIALSNVGKRFNRDWIFRKVNIEFLAGHTYAITGSNGSGKSTLLQILGGSMIASEGTIDWHNDTASLDENKVHTAISFVAPYLEVVEEMTLTEFLSFHAHFKPFIYGLSIKEIIEKVGLQNAAEKQIRYYSSGMKQRVKLAQGIFSDVPVLLLDEPCTNLDSAGIQLYKNLVAEFCNGKTIIVSSNDINEYSFCETEVNIMEFK